MSGVVKALGVAFAAVVAPVALPALAGAAAPAASIFTAGAAAGGGSILTSTLLSAGKSAIVGGLISKATGGSFKAGAMAGAVAGAAGSLMGGFGKAMGGTVANGVEPVLSTKGAVPGAAGGFAAAPAAAGGAARGGFGQFLFGGENPLAGQLLKGAAEGYLAKAQLEDERGWQREQDDRVRDSYAGTGDALRYDQPLATRFDASTQRKPIYQYNPETRRIEKV